MTLNTKKRIWDLIHLVDVRNDNEKVSLLLWVTVEKKFIPSVANTIGTDMSNYKIIRKWQFACSLMQVRRDKKIPVALLKDYDEAIVTSAYPVFEVNDENEILPEYLMMWFSRKEFDRESCFYAVWWVRWSLEWEDFCNMKLPVPPITEQESLIKEYNLVQNKIEINTKIIQKLEDTAKAVYKQRFVDYDFPNDEWKPYKSNGWKLVYCDDLEKYIPVWWEYKKLWSLCTCVLWWTPSRGISEYWWWDVNRINSSKVNDIRIYSCSEKITQLWLKSSATKLLPKNTVVLAITWATLGQVSILNIESWTNQSVIWILETDNMPTEFIYEMIVEHMRELMREQTGWAQEHINKNDVESIKIAYPEPRIMQEYKRITKWLLDYVMNLWLQNYKLLEFQNILFQKLV